MKKRILLLVSVLSVLFLSSKAYAYWTNKFHFNVKIPVVYEVEVSVITDEEMQEQKEIKTQRIEQKIVTENEGIPLSFSDKEDKEDEENQEIKTEGQEEEIHTEESSKKETVPSVNGNQEQSQAEQEVFDLPHNEGN